jgi:DUF1680 family protein
MLLDLARKLRAQGYDWPGQFVDFKWKDKVTMRDCSQLTHVVNNAMALKTAAVWFEISGDRRDHDALYNQFSVLDRYHLLPNGIHSGDEHYAGHNPTQGSELCSVVESMFSLEHIIAVTGDGAFADRLEKIAYNPLPGTFSRDMWAHQYDQQANQVLCTVARRDWTNNDPYSNLFGLEPNYGCCTSNMHQGWPKFVASMWMATPDDGLAAVAYGPSEVTSAVRGGALVKIAEDTEYPFRGTVRLKVNPSSPVWFPLELHIPAWASGTEIRVNGKRVSGISPGTFHRIARAWRTGDRVEIVFPMRSRISRWYHDSVAIERGPLVYSLRIGEDWRKVKDHPRAPDWAVLPTTPWNYGLLVDLNDPTRSFRAENRAVGDYPFSPEGAPVLVKAKGRRIPGWQIVNDSAGPLPASPVSSDEPVEDLALVPYGSAKLRITAFPLLTK